MVEVLHTEVGQLACCSQPMDLLIEKPTHVRLEKHVPILEKIRNKG